MIGLRVSEAAALSIVEQADYYQQASGLALALRWAVAVDDAVHSLLSLPERSVLCRFRTSSLADMRWILIAGFPKHMVFYRYLREEEAIVIVQLLHGARNLATILDEDS